MSAQRGRLSSIVLVILLAGAAYWCWKFLPVYAQGFKVRGEVKDYVASLQRKTRKPDIEAGVMARLEGVGLDPELVELEVDVGRARNGLLTRVEILVRYAPVIEHPIVNMTTTMDTEFTHSREFGSDW